MIILVSLVKSDRSDCSTCTHTLIQDQLWLDGKRSDADGLTARTEGEMMAFIVSVRFDSSVRLR